MGLRLIAERLRANRDQILGANARDIAAAQNGGHSPALIDRLSLDAGRLADMADAVETVGALADPVGRQLAALERPNGPC